MKKSYIKPICSIFEMTHESHILDASAHSEGGAPTTYGGAASSNTITEADGKEGSYSVWDE